MGTGRSVKTTHTTFNIIAVRQTDALSRHLRQFGRASLLAAGVVYQVAAVDTRSQMNVYRSAPLP